MLLQLLTNPRVFGMLICVLNLGACIAWGMKRDWFGLAYWFFAFGLNFTVTFFNRP